MQFQGQPLGREPSASSLGQHAQPRHSLLPRTSPLLHPRHILHPRPQSLTSTHQSSTNAIYQSCQPRNFPENWQQQEVPSPGWFQRRSEQASQGRPNDWISKQLIEAEVFSTFPEIDVYRIAPTGEAQSGDPHQDFQSNSQLLAGSSSHFPPVNTRRRFPPPKTEFPNHWFISLAESKDSFTQRVKSSIRVGQLDRRPALSACNAFPDEDIEDRRLRETLLHELSQLAPNSVEDKPREVLSR